MAIKTYGTINLTEMGFWLIGDAQPHVIIKLKSLFPKIKQTARPPFSFRNTPENCADLLWFMDRYPLAIDAAHRGSMEEGRSQHMRTASDLEAILVQDYVPKEFRLRDGHRARHYQAQGADFDEAQKRFLLGDDLGLGKTLTAILTFANPKKMPVVVVVQTHLPTQWKVDGIEKFTDLSVHIIKRSTPYSLPPADVYILKYSFLAKWTSFFGTGFFRGAVFDEIQELRREGSQKYEGGMALSESVDYCLAMSATPIYNYGDEIFNILDLVKPGCLGDRWDFLREWAVPSGKNYVVTDPNALGTYLRDNYLFLRRTREDVGRELPPVNTIVTTVGYDEKAAKRAEEVALGLSIKVTGGSFMERGSAARELDAFMRYETGIAKARDVAAYVRIILENGDPVLLSGWHRDVYEIWLEELADFRPVMYTGSESPKQKEGAKRAFMDGDTNLFIISNRSGIGLDGLQHRCRDVVIGELDWSPQVHKQIIGRVDRDGNMFSTTVHFPVCDFGSDPFIIGLLGLKTSQSDGIINPLGKAADQHTDDSRIKMMAESFIAKHKNKQH